MDYHQPVQGDFAGLATTRFARASSFFMKENEYLILYVVSATTLLPCVGELRGHGKTLLYSLPPFS